MNEETEWIRAARAGDGHAFRRLYQAHVDRVYRLTYRMTGDEDMARDCTQETFIRAFRKLDQFRGEAAFSTWLHTIARMMSLNGLRQKARHANREVAMDEGSLLAADPRARPPEVGVAERLRSAIDDLPEIYRTVFLMHDLEGHRHEDIAQVLEVAVGTSKARLHRARARLRESLADLAPEMVG